MSGHQRAVGMLQVLVQVHSGQLLRRAGQGLRTGMWRGPAQARTDQWGMPSVPAAGGLGIHAYPDDNVAYRDIPVSALPAKVYLCRF